MINCQGLRMLSMRDLENSMIREMKANGGGRLCDKKTGSPYQYLLKQGIVVLHYNLPSGSSACAVRPISRNGVEFARDVMEAHIKKGMIAIEWEA